jgi:hypothetical protein
MRTTSPLSPVLASIPALPALSPRAQDALKLAAMLAMLADHANRALNPNPHAFPGLLLDWQGRLAFPLFALLLAHNLAARGVSWHRYLVPLLASGFLAQVPFHAVINPNGWNVMFTLLLGVLSVALSDWLDRVLFSGAGAFGVIGLAPLNLLCDFPLFGFALVPLGVQLVRSRNALWWLPFLGLCLLTNLLAPPAWIALILPLIVLAAARAFPPENTVGNTNLRFLPRSLGYAFYPLHLLALMALKGAGL